MVGGTSRVAHIYEQPDHKSKVLYTLYSKSEVVIEEVDGLWGTVINSNTGQKGYIRMALIYPVDMHEYYSDYAFHWWRFWDTHYELPIRIFPLAFLSIFILTLIILILIGVGEGTWFYLSFLFYLLFTLAVLYLGWFALKGYDPPYMGISHFMSVVLSLLGLLAYIGVFVVQLSFFRYFLGTIGEKCRTVIGFRFGLITSMACLLSAGICKLFSLPYIKWIVIFYIVTQSIQVILIFIRTFPRLHLSLMASYIVLVAPLCFAAMMAPFVWLAVVILFFALLAVLFGGIGSRSSSSGYSASTDQDGATDPARESNFRPNSGMSYRNCTNCSQAICRIRGGRTDCCSRYC